MSNVEMCEGCNAAPATTFDCEGVPLCKACSELPPPIVSAPSVPDASKRSDAGGVSYKDSPVAATTLSEPKPEVKEEPEMCPKCLHSGPFIEGTCGNCGTFLGEPNAPADNAQAVLQNTLLPCPFCGFVPTKADVHSIAPGTNEHHQCAGCHAYGPRAFYPEDATKFWNQRVAPSVVAGVGEHAMGVSSDEEIARNALNDWAGVNANIPLENLHWSARKLYAAFLAAIREAKSPGDKFKAFVHSYLTQHGVPEGDPTNQHQIEGCRIGARLDLLLARVPSLSEPKESEEEKQSLGEPGAI